MSCLPPSTRSQSNTEPSEDYPAYCKIGKKPVSAPLVTLQQLRAHLYLLRAIKELRSTVEKGTDERFPEYVKTLQPAQRWIWMIGLATERFMRWALSVRRTDLSAWLEDQLPPLDVLMIWHTYMLNPSWYAEDCDRLNILKGLKSVDDYLIGSLVMVGDISTYEPSDAHRQSWRDTCGTSWDPLNAAGDGSLEYRNVVCPQCLHSNSVPNVDDKGYGYMQNNFMAECTQCGGWITKERLAVHKFARDLVRDHTVDEDVQEYGLGVYMPGTLRTQTQTCDTILASNTKKRLWNTKACSDSFAAVAMYQPQTAEETARVWERSLLLEIGYSMDAVRKTVRQALPSKAEKWIDRTLSAYTSDCPLSVELTGAVLRQGAFIDKMHELGWTCQERHSSKEDSVILAHAIARYHAFLDLLSTSNTLLFVPTLDIDLVWHTHQLTVQGYADDCMQYLGRYIDHDDKVEESHLANSFDITCRAWQRRFGIPYTYCGCPEPLPENGIKRLKTVVSRLNLNLSATSVPPPNLRPPLHVEAQSATHASEHNAFLFASSSQGFDSRERLARQEKIREWRNHEEKAVKKTRTLLPAKEDVYSDHDPAFLAPPPFWAFSGAPIGVCTVVAAGGDGLSGSCRTLG